MGKHPFLPITWAFSVGQTACLILRASNITPRWSVFRRRVERVPSSGAVCFIVGYGVFHRRIRRITRPATRCSVGSSMPHRLYDPESHNPGGYSRRPGERRVATGRAKHGSQSGKERLTDRQSEKTCAANCELQINVVTLPSLGWRTSSTSEASKLESFHSA